MKYFVTVGDRQMEVEVDGDVVTVDGETMDATADLVAGTPEVRLAIDGAPFRLAIDQYADGVWRLVHQGSVVEVEAVDERTRHIRSLVGATRGTGAGGVLKAPMPGLVVRIAVAEGDRVAAGQGLVVLEAMKMENELKAQADGVVRRVLATIGAAVEKGQVLVELDPAGGA